MFWVRILSRQKMATMRRMRDITNDISNPRNINTRRISDEVSVGDTHAVRRHCDRNTKRSSVDDCTLAHGDNAR